MLKKNTGIITFIKLAPLITSKKFKSKSITMKRTIRSIRTLIFTFLLCGISYSILPAQNIPSPKEHFGFNIGDDYTLATYTQTEAYFRKLDASDRVKLVDIGMTEEGRHEYMVIVSSPENIRNLDRYREISGKLARAEGLDEDAARLLSDEGRAVVWIDGGLHATEVVGTHQLIETVWQLASRNDRETLDILNNVIVLLVHANPDGQELVSSWYMKDADTLKRRTNIPRLYQKYVGHDNNRDFYLMAMKETQNMSRQLYVEWFPQILYNHHQSGPAGTVLAGPPFRDPFNYVFDPLVMTSLDAVGAAMVSRLNSEGKPGYTQRSGASYSTWYNGGLRTTSYFHNIIGLLTEIIGNPTPMEIPLVLSRLLPNGATPYPVTPQKWHFRQSIDYSVSLNYAVLDYASRNRNELLYNMYRMGMNSIERGSKDYVTMYPKVIDAIRNSYSDDRETPAGNTNEQDQRTGYGGADRIPLKYYEQYIGNPLNRDPRAYIIPSDQDDFPTAVKFVNTLIMSGILVNVATEEFSFNGKDYPAGSYIVKTDQAFRPHVLDMFEPQDHPNDLQYPGGPPIPPYDAAGWTLAFQMSVAFDRIQDNIEGPFKRIPFGEVQSPPARVVPSGAKAGYIISPKINNAFIVVNDLLNNNIRVYRIQDAQEGNSVIEPGAFFIPSSAKALQVLTRSSSENGVPVRPVSLRPDGLTSIEPARIAIWNRYGGSMNAGWLSWIMEQFHFQYKMIYPQEIDAGKLKNKYDVIIFMAGAIPSGGRGPGGYGSFSRSSSTDDIPEDYQGWTGNITVEKSIPEIRKFLEDGGTVITMESSTSLASLLELPVENALTREDEDGSQVSLRNTEFYIPGSLLTMDINTDEASNWGMNARADVYFDQSPVFRFKPGFETSGIKKLAWFSTDSPLHSGWALGQQYLKEGIVAFMAPVGSGELYAFGPEITFRGQTHGTFKMLFNELYR